MEEKNGMMVNDTLNETGNHRYIFQELAQLDDNVPLSKDEIQSIRNPWTSSLIVKFHGKGFRYRHFLSKLKSTWKPVGDIKCISLGYGFYLVNLSLEEDLIRVTKEATWFIGDNVLTIRQWEPNFRPSKADPSPSVPTWVRLPELPIEYYDTAVLEKIGNQIGQLLRIDSKTAARERARFARLCIQVDFQKPLPRSIKIGLLEQPIQYEGIKLRRPTCGTAGHNFETCPSELVQPIPVPTETQEIEPSLSTKSSSPSPPTPPVSEMVVEKPLPIILPPLVSQGTRKWKYDVFMSFRGEETRKGFASHLFHALEHHDIHHYRDSDQGERGQEIAPMLLDAIQHSRIALVLFSSNYADSRWCLDELVEIMNCSSMYKDQGHVVFPIFYNVTPSDVRAQRGLFGEGYRRCSDKSSKQKADAWITALEQAANLSGWDLKNETNGEESKLISIIVDEILSRISFVRSTHYVEDIVGRDSDVNHLVSLLSIGSDDVRVIGIYGIDGIGKTALAKVICSRIFSRFGSVSFLENVGDTTEGDLVNFQKKLERDLKLRRLMSHSNDAKRNISDITSKLHEKRILLVLDDVKSKNQVTLLGGVRDSLGPGSRILITTTDEQLLDHLNVDEKYLVPPLGKEESHQLFSKYAFNQNSPEECYQELSKNIVHYAGGFPRALEKVGTILGKQPSKDQWCNKVLQKLVENPNLDIIWHDLNPDQSLKAYGGEGRVSYNDNIYTGIRKIIVAVVSSMVESISIQYDRNGSVVHTRRYGGTTRESKTHTVKLNYPKEYLTSISGYIKGHDNDAVIQSLTIHSNARHYGPFGKQEGKRFFIDSKDGERIVGFFGKFGSHLNSIGAYFREENSFNQTGPFGSKDDITWDDRKHQDVRRIEVEYDSMMRSISIVYDNYGHPVGPFTHGTKNIKGKTELATLDFADPDEYLTSISGYTMKSSDTIRLQSLTIHTNRRSYGPFGAEEGNRFLCTRNNFKIVGFFGRCNTNGDLESIGAHVEPISHIYPLKRIGPFGGEDGNPWDDGQKNNLRKIVIRWDNWVDSVSFIYGHEGQPMETFKHGGNDGRNEKTVDLGRDEYLTRMSGYYDRRDTCDVVKSLTFESNKRIFGPFGNLGGTHFQSPPNLGKIVGFYGRSGRHLISIGAYFTPIFHIFPLKTIGPFGGDGGGNWDDGRHTGIRQIYISYGVIIDGICCVYDDNGKPSLEPKHRGERGGCSYTIKLNCPNEYINSVSGHVGQYGNGIPLLVKSLTFKTNCGEKHGPFGTEEGVPFSFESNIGKIVGFYGRCGPFLDSIGAYVELLSGNGQ